MCIGKFNKFIFSIVIISMMLNLFPLNLLADTLRNDEYYTNSEKEVKEIENISNEQEEKEDLKVRGELTNDREENVKKFLNSDNTITTAIYQYPVHYLKDGKWEDIDNSLSMVTDNKGKKQLQNKNNAYKVNFENVIDNDKIVSIEKDSYKISWSLIGSNKVNQKLDDSSSLKNKKNQLNEQEQKLTLEKISSNVSYEDILKNVDLQYSVISDQIKESIVLKSEDSIKDFKFKMDIGDMYPELNSDNSISIYKSADKKDIIYNIQSPYMYDNNMEFCDKIEVKLYEDNGYYNLEIIPNKEWLNSNDRVYPIVIDPTIGTSLDYTAIQDTYIYPTDYNYTNRYQAHILRAGSGITDAKRSLIKFNLPNLSTGDQVIDAKLWLCNYPETSEWTPTTRQIQLNVHRITKDWAQETASWSNMADNSYDTKVSDYFVYSYDANNPYKFNSCDVTSIVKDWYVSGNNYGLMIKEPNETTTGKNEAYFLSANTNSTYTEGRPQVTITYRNATGLESYWTYHEQNIGRAGTSYVNDYNGNLVLMNADFSTPGDRLPVSINHVFNTNYRKYNMNFGAGWRLNLSQMINLETIDKIQYAKYVDEDGTNHYFRKQDSTNKYIDEDGLGLELTLNSDSTFTMKDKKSNTMKFEKRTIPGGDAWHLNKITDVNGNSITISFLAGYPNNFYISQVTDAAGSVITFNWSNGKLASMVDQNSRVITYGYDQNSNLTSITYPDSKKVIYNYDSNGLMTSAKNIDNSRIDYLYNNAIPYRISSVKEYGTDGTQGNSLSFKYGSNVTTFTDNKNYSNSYNFDNLGRTINVSDFGNDSNNINKAYGKVYQYGNSSGENNKLKLESKLMASVTNKVVNGNIENNGGWTYDAWGNKSNATAGIVSDTAYYGSKSLKINKTVADSGKNFYFQELNLEKGKKYTLSAYMKTNNVTSSNNAGASMSIWYTNKDGVVEKISEYVTGTTDWNRYSLTFEYPQDATWGVNIGFGISKETGTVYIDGIQLEEGETSNPYNLIENSSFNNGTSNWTVNGNCDQSVDKVTTSENSFRFTGNANISKNIFQTVNVSGKKGDIFSVSGWAKSSSVPLYGSRANNITVGVVRKDGTTQWFDVNINPDSSSWQYVSNEFTTDSDYNYIYVYLTYYNNANDVYFDNIGLYKENFGQSYQYDKEGNLISTQDMSKQNSTLQYNGKNELLKETNPTGGSYTYEYDSQVKGRLLSAINNSKIKYSFNYDSYGNATSTKVENVDEIASQVSVGKTYYIRSKSSGLYFDINGGKVTNNGANVNQYNLHGALNQRWVVADAGSGYYTFKPVYAQNMALNLNTQNKNNIDIWTGNSSNTQKFKLVKNTDGSYRIICKNNESDKVLTVLNNSKDINVNIVEEKFENKENQSFFFEEVGVNNSEDKSVLESGEIFYIKSKNSNLYLDYMKDSSGNITEKNENKLVQRTFTGSDSQKWRIVRKDNGYYKLIPVFSITGRALDLESGKNENNNPVQVYNYVQETPNQEWRIYKDGDAYRISSVATDNSKNLTVKNASKDSEAQIIIYENKDENNQKWYLESANTIDIEDGATYKIKSKASGLYLGIINKQDQNGSFLKQLIDNSQNGQEWKFVNLKNGYYKIIAAHSSSGRVIEVAGGISTNGTSIKQWEWNGTEAQQWEFVPVGDGSFSIKPRLIKGRSSLDVPEGLSTPESTLQVYDSNNSAAQRFYIEKVSKPTSEYIESKATYKENGRFVDTVSDSIGNKVTYNYNFANNKGTGTLKEIIDAKGNKTSYEYDNLDRITKTELVGKNNTYKNLYGYDNDKISSITHNGFNINFFYDNFGNTKQIKIANQVLVTNNYETSNGNLKNVQYGNNQTMSYEYDRFSRVSKKTGTNGTQEYVYDARGNLGVQKDNVNNVTYKFTYDLANRLVETNSTNNFKTNYNYDKNGNIDKVKYSLLSLSNEIKYSYDNDNKITSIKLDNDKYVMYNYDRLSRLKDKKITRGTKSYTTEFTYLSNTNNSLQTTNILKSIKNGTSASINYTYDKNGNIERIEQDSKTKQEYYYDELNQLVRENNKELDKTIIYTYDAAGNIQKIEKYAYTQIATAMLESSDIIEKKEYSYDTVWKDKLVSYDGKAITYDAIGNPLTYGNNTYTWENGRQLASINSEGKQIKYKYNDSGIRTEKTVNGVTTKYYLEGDKVIYEKTGDNTIYYQYGGDGNLVGFKYNNEDYYYLRNGQGDITGILDKDLKEVISYTYDTWGSVVSIKDGAGNDVTNNPNSIGNINPYRYRGYRYDNETQMYYLQSRYYNPELGRFINADNMVSTGQGLLAHNMFAYCNNNPVMNIDPDGHFVLLGLIIGITVAAIVTTVAVIINSNYQNNIAQNQIAQVQNTPNVPDRTDKINETLKTNATDIKTATKNMNTTQKYNYFANNVKTGAKYDLKSTNEWKSQTVKYNGVVMEPQDIGNYNYGYIGRAAGIPKSILIMGAGVYQTLGNTRHIPWIFTKYCGDDPRDSYYINMGAIAYDKGN